MKTVSAALIIFRFLCIQHFAFAQNANFTYQDTCYSTPTQFTLDFPGPADSVQWSFDDPSGNNNITTQVNPIHLFSSPGNYDVRVIVYFQLLSDTAVKTVHVMSTPLVALGNDTTLCEGFQIFFNATNDSSIYQWNDGFPDPIRFVDTSGTYAITVTNIYGCSAYDIVHVDLQFEPEVYLGEDTAPCSGQPLKLDATNYGATYQWQDGSTGPTFNPIFTAIYGVSATNQCGIAADSISIEFRDCNCLVFLPKSFTPNSDNKNDMFNYKYHCTEFAVYMRIFNRIGQLMFYSENPDIGWDGKYNGKPAEEGVYVYQLHYSGYGDGKLDERTERGTFLLLR